MADDLHDLQQYISTLNTRIKEIRQVFAGSEIDPFKNKDFVKFLEDHISELASYYVIFGKFLFRDRDSGSPVAEQRAKGNFVVSGESAPSSNDQLSFYSLPAVKAALDAGLDLESND